MRTTRRRSLAVLMATASPAVVVAAVAVSVVLPPRALADWTTYRADAARSGVDSSSVGSLPFAPAWSSPSLSGQIYAEPLVYDGLVIVATESNEVAALSEATGQLVWQASAGTPVKASSLPCGDISPTVGVTSTPVIDPATGDLFVVADDLVGGSIVHEMYAFNAATGASLPGFPASVEPPGDTPAAQLQRASLALDGNEVVVGYGGNDGDCSTYHGWLVAESETGGAPTASFSTPSTQSAIWGAGDGPAVDAAGNVWAATGNGNARTFGDQESVLELSPSLQLEGLWAPSNWSSLDSGDQDLSTSSPALLSGGLVFQVGKQGIGYLLNSATLGGAGAAPVFQAQVCSSFGGDAVDGSTLYVACSDGVRAVAVNTSARTFSILWHGPTAAEGPPIVAGGLVWVTNYAAATLLGLNPQTGAVVVTQPTPAMEHFSIPSASNGKLFLATGQTVQAYTIANPGPAPATPTPSGSPAPAPAAPPGSTAPSPAGTGAHCTLKLRSSRVRIHHRQGKTQGKGRRRRRRTSPRTLFGTLAVRATCNRTVRVTVSGHVTERLPERRHRTSRIGLVHARLAAHHTRTLGLRVSASVVRALRRHRRETGTFALTARPTGVMAGTASGASTARATVHARLRL